MGQLQTEEDLFGKKRVGNDAAGLEGGGPPPDEGPGTEENTDVPGVGEDETAAPPEDGGPPAFGESAPPAAQQEAPAGDTEPLDDPAQRLAEELDALNDRYLRLAAEFDNFRRRTRQQTGDLAVRAQMEMARKVLPAMDDLARVAAIPNETTTVEALDEGIELILRNLTKELAELGLERIEAAGERFDPELHQGMMVTPTDDPELDDTVSRVFVDGYRLRGQLVRPSQVEVLSYDPEAPKDA